MPETARAAYRWIEPEPVSGEKVASLESALNLPSEICEVLVRRGIRTPTTARSFLRPRFSTLHDPLLLPDLEPAAARIEFSIRKGERILVHGDYDADGMCAAALLTRGLLELEGRPSGYVPHRTRDGYDFGASGLQRARALGVGLIITADCGTAAVEAIRAADRAGIDVIVTDHHRPPPELPEAAAIVNPNLEESGYPFRGLAGVGVVYKLLSALYERAGRRTDELNPHLDLVALGTVADRAPLEDENRLLVRAGLRVMRKTLKPGLRALLETAGLDDGRELNAGDLGFSLAPRLNSVGRMAEAESGYRLLVTEDPGEARELAGELESRNRERRREDRRVLAEARSRLDQVYDRATDQAVVLWGEGWHPGVIGIAASRIVDLIHRPVVLVSMDGGLGRGSGRSIPGFPLHEALERCSGLLERHGGHPMAAGLDIRRSNLEAFASRLQEIASEHLVSEQLVPRLELELSLPLDRVDTSLHRWLSHLAPFGSDNTRPVLMSEDVGFEGIRRVGREDDHLKAVLTGSDGARLEAIGFGLGERADDLAEGSRWDVAFELVENVYRGRGRLQARLRDFRPRD